MGVVGVVQAGGDIESSRWSAWAAASHPRVLAAVAIHPNEAPAYAEQGMLDEAIAVISELIRHGRLVATETILEGGVPAFPDALLGLFDGVNTGKLLLKV